MTKELTPKEWMVEIGRGLEFRRQYGMEDQWAEAEGLFNHVMEDGLLPGPNIVASTGDALLASLMVPNPYIMVKPIIPTKPAIRGARILESVDNMLHNQLEIGQEMENAALHSYLWGRGILKIGYDSEYGYEPSEDVGGASSPLGMTLTQFDTKHNRIEYGATKPGMPWVSSVLPHDFVVPWGCRDIRTTPWVAHRIIRHIDSVKADPKYAHTQRLQPVLSLEDHVKSYQRVRNVYRIGEDMTIVGPGQGDREYVELWEIHDRRTGKIYVVVAGHNDFIRETQDWLQIEGQLPFVSFSLVPAARNFWVTPDTIYLKPSQSELIDITVQGQKQRRASVLKFLIERGFMTEEELEKLLSSEVGLAAFYEMGRNPQTGLHVLQPGTNQQLFMEASQVRADAQEVVGFNRNQVGQYTSGRRSATEASYVQQGASLRMSRRQMVLRRAYCDLYKVLNNIITDFWQTPQLTSVFGPAGEQLVQSFTGPELKGRYRYDVMFNSENGDTLQSRRMLAMQMFQMLGKAGVDPRLLMDNMVSAFNDPELTAYFGSIPQQQAQQGQQMAQAGAGMGQPPAGMMVPQGSEPMI